MTDSESRIAEYWEQARAALPDLPSSLPQAWAFGAIPEHADELLSLVLSGIKTATASSLWDYEASAEPLPEVGEYSIVLDGEGTPRAVIVTTDIRTVPFDEVTAEHAYLEGEGDRSLPFWKDVHERFWRSYSENSRGFAPDMPVICERFRLMYGAESPGEQQMP